jgi:hypothetical protein
MTPPREAAPRHPLKNPAQESQASNDDLPDVGATNREQGAVAAPHKRAGVGQVQQGDGSPANPYSEVPGPGDSDDLHRTPISDQT